MNIRHEKVYEQLKAIAPTVMLTDDINFVNWRGRFQQLGKWFGKRTSRPSGWSGMTPRPPNWPRRSIPSSAAKPLPFSRQTRCISVRTTSIAPRARELVYDALKLAPSSGVPEGVWGEVVDAEYFARIDADHIFFFSDDGQVGDTADSVVWQNLKAVQNGNVYLGANNLQYDMAYTPNGKLIYMEKLANAILHRTNVE
jgi:iron complex transport system substrate-binding protein